MRLLRFQIGKFWRGTFITGTVLLLLLVLPALSVAFFEPTGIFSIGWRIGLSIAAAGLVVVIVVLAVPPFLKLRRRHQVFTEVARAHGLERTRPNRKLQPPLHLMYGGDAGYDLRVLEGLIEGRTARAGDHQLAVFLPITMLCDTIDIVGFGPAENTVTIDCSYAFVPTPAVKFPRLLVRGETGVDRVKAAAGLEDIDFESHVFSEAFYVQSSDRRFAYDMITPQFMELVLAHRGYSVIFDDHGVVVMRGLRQWPAEEFAPALALAVRVVKQVPNYVWERYAAAAESW